MPPASPPASLDFTHHGRLYSYRFLPASETDPMAVFLAMTATRLRPDDLG